MRQTRIAVGSVLISGAKANCQAAIAACNSSAEVDLTPAECDALGAGSFCTEGTGGTGGAGGGSGVDGCNESLCAEDAERRALCEEFIPACIVYCEAEGEACAEDECIAIALVFICNEQ